MNLVKAKKSGGGWHIIPQSWALIEFNYYGPYPHVFDSGGVGVNDVTVWFLKLR